MFIFLNSKARWKLGLYLSLPVFVNESCRFWMQTLHMSRAFIVVEWPIWLPEILKKPGLISKWYISSCVTGVAFKAVLLSVSKITLMLFLDDESWQVNWIRCNCSSSKTEAERTGGFEPSYLDYVLGLRHHWRRTLHTLF